MHAQLVPFKHSVYNELVGKEKLAHSHSYTQPEEIYFEQTKT